MRLGISLNITRQNEVFRLSNLFGASYQGFTFEPWDITTLYQDRAGTTPVTAAGQSVGLRLDKSKGLRIGPELVTNGDFSSSTGWSLNGVSIAGGKLVASSAANGADARQAGKLTAGVFYQVNYTVDSISGGSVRFFNASQAGLSRSSPGTYTEIFTGTNTALGLQFVTTGVSATIDNISVRELAGNHEVAINDAARGVYGREPKTGRRNLLNATATLSTQSVTVTAVAHTLAFTGTGTVTLSGVSTAGPLVGTGASNRVTLTFTPTAGSLTLTVTGSVTLAQLQIGSVDTAYQSVVSQYDITEAGVASCYYVQTDGVDDAYVTPTITPGTDKAQVFAGVRNQNASTVAALIEHSTSTATNNGAFIVAARESLANYFFASKGTISGEARSAASYAAPVNNVLTALGDISGDTATLRVNGTQVAQSTTDQGTGNFLAYPAYIYARGGTSLPFNGRDYGHAVRFGPNLDAATIARVEALIARNTPTVTL